jgi:carbamoyl-phosphate synthase large subunit
MHRVDAAHIVHRVHDSRHIPELLALVSRHEIDLVVPLIDSDLAALSRAADRFAELACTVLISDEDVIRTCGDKMLTFAALKSAGIDTPQTWSAEEALALKRHRFPYFLKPRRGSAGKGLFRVDNLDELKVFLKRSPDNIVQEFVRGDEYTLDVYAGFDGVPRCVVPRKRLEVRSGEVSKGMIVKDRAVMEIGRQVVSALSGCRGVITVQCMLTPRRRIRVIEINPRFGGGAPLAIEAGADFPKWIMAELLGRKLRIDYDGYRDSVVLLRYDQSVFAEGRMMQDRSPPRPAARKRAPKKPRRQR